MADGSDGRAREGSWTPRGARLLARCPSRSPAYLQLQVGPVDLSRSRDEIERQLVDELGADETDDLDVVVRTGHPSRVILDLAVERGHDCIVMASREPGVGQILLGSTAAAVVRHAQCAVHVLRG